jgi:hypothetical protein
VVLSRFTCASENNIPVGVVIGCFSLLVFFFFLKRSGGVESNAVALDRNADWPPSSTRIRRRVSLKSATKPPSASKLTADGDYREWGKDGG